MTTLVNQPSDSNKFIPSITGGITCKKGERTLSSFPPNFYGLGILIFAEPCPLQYENSLKSMKGICTKIINQTRQYETDDESLAIKNKIQSARMK